MIVQEPVQAAIWHCLNHYDFSDAIFLSERLYAEVKTDDSLFLLATTYYRSGQIDHAYYILKDKSTMSSQCRYLLSSCAFEMQKYAEAEMALTDTLVIKSTNFEEIIEEYEDQASFALLLLAKISAKTGRRQQAIDAYKRALKINPFLWSCFESMCNMGEKPNASTYFQLSELENLNQCHGKNLSNIESVVLTCNQTNTPIQENQAYITTPQQIFSNTYAPVNNINPTKICTPEDSPLANPLCLSGFSMLPSSRIKLPRFKMIDSLNTTSPATTPSFGHIVDDFMSTPNIHSQPNFVEVTEQKSFTKKMRSHVGNLLVRKEAILQNSKPVFSQTGNVNNTIPMTPSTPATVSSGPNVRRSSRLFSNSYSVKENNKSPNRNKFATPKSPSRKTKQRLAKCSLNDFNSYMDLNTKNRLKKEKSETVTSAELKTNSAITNLSANSNSNATQLQKQSAEGLMCLLRDMGQAYLHMSQYNCKLAIEELNQLPPHQFQTTWVYSMLGLAYFEMTDYENAVKHFSEIRSREPYRIKHMDIYSTSLWHLQKEVTLSALAQDLLQLNKNSAVTWIVSGNCFSLHKEHDTAIKFLHRAVQVDPTLPYAYTLLGHEYITTEELDKAMSCYRNAIRLDPRHYNAWFGIGTIYSKQERYHLAEINYNKALSINPHSSVILCHIGVVQHSLKKIEKALSTLNSAIAKESKNPLCKFHRASIYFAIGGHTEALKELEELKDIVPKESLVYYLTGKVHKKLGNTDLALMHFSWATDLDPKGASGQIKEAFDPSIGRTAADTDSPASPPVEEYPSEGNSVHHDNTAFSALQEDSDDSL
ncbi:PREDICTED: cell division cycle protein 27 homolog [Nicrophorus vespilloides]|uniref:Cell division cycle protein 27 homolog n=1 Tax=Nicrophorus vespilloides TaxID=110193 RepID=A0ABM1MCT1_NICVS|nr:PREDICTED: cell division cycle protein 27 homolog [Nicrophorus vespilloides]